MTTGISASLEHVLESVVRITEQRSRETLESCLVNTLSELTGACFVSITQPLWREEATLIECLAYAERGETTLPHRQLAPVADHPLVASALERREEVVEVTAEGRHRHCLPLFSNDDELVAFVLVEGQGALAGHLALVRGIAAVYRNYLGILHDAERDALTGLRNRKTFDDNLARIIARADAERSLPLDSNRRQRSNEARNWLAICDIDHFKRVNDTWGHVYGDEILLLFATLMRKLFRANDQLFRFGGEEFVVVLAPTTAENAAAVFERFRATVEAFDFPQVGRVTVSIGFVEIHADDVNAVILGRADRALYWAKEHGRNQVCHFEALEARGLISEPKPQSDLELF